MSNDRSYRPVAEWFLRIALAVSFLSAVADRFGLWGKPGTPGVAWGDWAHFRGYADLLIPWRRPWIALASGVLLSSFALAMTFAMSPKAPLDYSVWSAAAGSFVLASLLAREQPANRGA